VSFYVSTATFILLHCDEWDRIVALPRHKFVTGATLLQLEILLPSDGFLFNLLEVWDVGALSIRKTADLLLQLWVGTFSRFMAIRFYFLSETLI
jgi:hypothetical protein